MRVDIAQLEALPQHVRRCGKVLFVVRIQISRIEVNHHAIIRIALQAVPRHGHTVTGAVRLVDKLAFLIGIAVRIVDDVAFHRRRHRKLIRWRPGDNRAQIGHVLLLFQATTMVIAIVVERGTVFQQGV